MIFISTGYNPLVAPDSAARRLLENNINAVEISGGTYKKTFIKIFLRLKAK
jgi:hypothetical protein